LFKIVILEPDDINLDLPIHSYQIPPENLGNLSVNNRVILVKLLLENFLRRIFKFFIFFIHHCFICHPSDSDVSEMMLGLNPGQLLTSALTLRRSNHLARSHPQV
jgi:hypothetical protein